MRQFMFIACLVIATSSCSTVCGERDRRALEGAVTNVVLHLDNARFEPVRKGWVFDYGFNDGAGMLNTYEYLHTLCSYKELQRLLPMKIFLRGPHTAESLDLANPFDFGRYNPAFVEYFHATLNVLLKNKAFVSATRGGMKKHGLLEKLSRLQDIHEYIGKHPEEFEAFKQRFEKALADKTWRADDYRTLIPKALDQDSYWNWSETAYYFWVRRDVDGTRALWISVINDILYAYRE